MATQDRSPSLFAGQPWSALSDSWSTADGKESDGSNASDDKDDNSDSMKLRKDDKYLFGICPSQDEFYLVVCEKCNQVIKPQALKRHMVNRHGMKESKSHIKASIDAGLKTGSEQSHKPMPPTKASLKEPPRSAISNLGPKMAALSNKSNNSSGSSSVKKSQPMPVVKVERISEQLTKRTMSVNQETAAKPTALINGTAKSSSSGSATPPTPPVSQPTHASVVSVVTTTTTTSKSSITSSNTISSATTTVTASATTASVVSAAPTLPSPKPAVASPSVTPPSSSKTKSPKERKFLPCKDREFDPDKHCGCWIPDIAKQCTRSLTCKTHALSLRRAVKGRSKTFDELLKEHRAAKELLLKQKAEMAAKAAAASGTGAGAGPGGGGSSKASHNDNAHSKDSHSKVPHPSTVSPSQKNKSHAKPHNSVFQRPTSSGPQTPSTHIKEEPVAMDTSTSRLSVDEGEEDQDKVDATYLPYHPQPAAMCRFGARFNGSGCYAFSRRTDYVRAAFLSALERHLQPPPHKKLCVESNLPKEPHLVTNSKDPYEFNMDDISGGSHNFSGVINSANKSATKPKSKSASSTVVSSSSSSSRTSKSVRDSSGSRSPGSSSGSVVNSNPAKRKRSGSSQGGGGSLPSSVSSVTPTPAISNVIGTMAALSTPTNPNIAIAIPNLGGAIGHFNATLTNKQNQVPKNNVNIKDFNLVLTTTGLDSLNGQYITSAQLADLTSQQVVAADDKNTVHRSRSISGGTKTASGAKLTTNNLDTLKTLHNNSVLMSQNAVLVDGLQGTVLAPVNLTTLSNSNMATAQANQSTAPSHMFRTDSLNPHVSIASPLPNGIVPSPSDKSGTSQRHTSSLSKQGHNKSGGNVTMNLSPGLLQTAQGQLGSTQLCTSQTLTTAQLAQLQVKPSALNMKGMTGKITMQPMSVTIPIMSQALPGQQAQQHTLLVTTSSEDGSTKQELHLQQIPSSPSNVIS